MDELEEYNNAIENVVEFIKNDERMTVTLSQKRFINKVLSLAEQFPDEVEVVCVPEDNDGYLVARMPVSYLKFSHRVMSEEQKEAAKERLAEARGLISKK